MRSFGLVVGLAVLLTTAGSIQGRAADAFDRKLSNDRQAVHVLNRLTFGPRPGDIDEIRRIGIETWIRQQLNPHQIPEDSELEATLKPLASLQLATSAILEKYRVQQPTFQLATPPLTQLLSPDEIRRLNTGSGDERRAILGQLSAEARRQVLVQLSPQTFEAQPDLKRAAEKARLIEQELRNRYIQEQQRRFRPPLSDLLTPEQAVDLQQGTDEEKTTVLTELGVEKRTRLFRSMQPQSVPVAFRREALDRLESAAGSDRRTARWEAPSGAALAPAARRGAGRLLVQPLQRLRSTRAISG